MTMIESACVEFDRPTSKGTAPKTKIGRAKVNGQAAAKKSKKQKGRKRGDGLRIGEDGPANIDRQEMAGDKISHLLEADFQLRNLSKLQRQLAGSHNHRPKCDFDKINAPDINVPHTIDVGEYDARIAAAEAMSTLASGCLLTGTLNSDSNLTANDNNSRPSSKSSSEDGGTLVIDTDEDYTKKRQTLQISSHNQEKSEEVQEDVVTSSSTKRIQKNVKRSPAITSLLQNPVASHQYGSRGSVFHAGVPSNIMPVYPQMSAYQPPSAVQPSAHPDHSRHNIPLCVSTINQKIETSSSRHPALLGAPKTPGKGKRRKPADQPVMHRPTFQTVADQYAQPNIHITDIVAQNVILNPSGDYIPPSKVSRTVETQTAVESMETGSSRRTGNSMPDLQMLTLGSMAVSPSLHSQAIKSGHQYVPVLPSSVPGQPSGPMVVHGGKHYVVVKGQTPAETETTMTSTPSHMCLPIVIDHATSAPLSPSSPRPPPPASVPNPRSFETLRETHGQSSERTGSLQASVSAQVEPRRKPKEKKPASKESQYKPPLPLSILNLPSTSVTKPNSPTQQPMAPVANKGDKEMISDQTMLIAQKQAIQRLSDNLARATGKERAFMLGQIQAILTLQRVNQMSPSTSPSPSPLSSGSNALLRAQLGQSGDVHGQRPLSSPSETGWRVGSFATSGGSNSENAMSRHDHQQNNHHRMVQHVNALQQPVHSDSPGQIQIGHLPSIVPTPPLTQPTGIPTVVQSVAAERSHLEPPSGHSMQSSPCKGSSSPNSPAENAHGKSESRERKHQHAKEDSSSQGSHLPFKKRRMAKFRAAESAASSPSDPDQSSSITTAAGDVESAGGSYQNSQIDPHVSLLCLSEIQTALRQDEDGDVPLHIAVAHENIAAVKKFVDLMKLAGKSVDVYNKDKQTPLHLAVITDQPQLVEILLNAGANVNSQNHVGHSSIHLAANKGYAGCLSILIRKCQLGAQLDKKDFEGYSPLHLAVQAGHIEAVKGLLHFGADANVQDGKSGRTPLFHATETNQREMADLLLRSQAKVNIMNYAGNTAVMAASGRSHTGIVTLLMQYGADTKGTNIGEIVTKGPPVRSTTSVALKQSMRIPSPGVYTPTSRSPVAEEWAASPGAADLTRKERGRPRNKSPGAHDTNDGS